MSDLSPQAAVTLSQALLDPRAIELVLRDVVRRVRERINQAARGDDENVLHIQQALDLLLIALAKIHARSFSKQTPRLLSLPSLEFVRSLGFEQEVCAALWIAGDEQAEAGILQHMRSLDYASQDHESWFRLGNLVKALGTCGTHRCVPDILDYLRANPGNPIRLNRDAIAPLVSRDLLTTADLLGVADDTRAQTSGRITCLSALHLIGWRGVTTQLTRLALDPIDAGVQRAAIRLLSLDNTDAARDILRVAYDKSPHDSVRAEAAEGLGRLRDIDYVDRAAWK